MRRLYTFFYHLIHFPGGMRPFCRTQNSHWSEPSEQPYPEVRCSRRKRAISTQPSATQTSQTLSSPHHCPVLIMDNGWSELCLSQISAFASSSPSYTSLLLSELSPRCPPSSAQMLLHTPRLRHPGLSSSPDPSLRSKYVQNGHKSLSLQQVSISCKCPLPMKSQGRAVLGAMFFTCLLVLICKGRTRSPRATPNNADNIPSKTFVAETWVIYHPQPFTTPSYIISPPSCCPETPFDGVSRPPSTVFEKYGQSASSSKETLVSLPPPSPAHLKP